MAFTIDQVNTQFDNLQAALTKGFAAWKAEVAALKAQIAAGSPVTQAQLDALGAKGDALLAAVTNFDINTPDNPIIPPTPSVVPAP